MILKQQVTCTVIEKGKDNGNINREMDGQMDRWMDGQMDRQMDRQMDIDQ